LRNKFFVLLFLISPLVSFATVAVIQAKDVTTTHADRAQIQKIAADFANAYIQGDKNTLKKLTTPQFMKTLVPQKMKVGAEVRGLQIVDDGFGLLVRFDYKPTEVKDWYQLPNGSWYRFRLKQNQWKIDSVVHDYTP